MRSLAAALETGAMTLYNHVTDREDLDVLVVDAVLGEADLPAAARRDWKQDVTAIATAVWRAVRGHPNAIPLILTRRSRSPVALAIAERLLAALARSGRSGRDLLIAFRAVTAFVMGFAQAELAGPLSVGRGEPAVDIAAQVRALPGDRYPHLTAIARAAVRSRADVEFRDGLRALLDGLTPGAVRRGPRADTS
ncbi:MAG TPA: TetR/AcrR family transcriptional regulator C-terminal domain-containing protein [Planctomycetota bacterium]|nr:TetR/AcrR family transcriptional regulator C-terminal domain-containing protein [Planctomycetota bacterium]